MTSQQAYDKTTDVLSAYAEGDLLGGNPMCHIEDFAQQEAVRFVNWITKNTLPAGKGKYYHKEYLFKGTKYKKALGAKQLWNKWKEEERQKQAGSRCE